MMLTEQIYAQAALLAGQLECEQEQLLKLLCYGAESSLKNRLRDGLTPEDCKADFVAAASLYALAAMNEAVEQGRGTEEFRAGDLTIRRNSSDTPSRCLHHQADLIMQPFLKDHFVFLGV